MRPLSTDMASSAHWGRFMWFDASNGQNGKRLYPIVQRITCLSAYFMYPTFLPDTKWTSISEPNRLKRYRGKKNSAKVGLHFYATFLKNIYQKTSSNTSVGRVVGLKTTNKRSFALLSGGASFFGGGRLTSV